jgi:DNA-binding NarL/FixJ family response regulator
MIAVALVDDHPLARRGLESILAEAEDLAVTVSTGSLELILDCGRAKDSVADVILLDLYLGSAQACFAAVAELSSASKVLVVSASGTPCDVLAAVRAGAVGYLSKCAEPDMVVAAVRTVSGGGFAMSSELADMIRAELIHDSNSDFRVSLTDPVAAAVPGRGTLSKREVETLELIARGFTHAQVAHRLGVTKATIDTYVERIRAKLHVGNKAELTRAAILRNPASRSMTL